MSMLIIYVTICFHDSGRALPDVSSHNQNGPQQKRTIEIKNVNFLNKYDTYILCIISMNLYVLICIVCFNYKHMFVCTYICKKTKNIASTFLVKSYN